MENNEVVKQDGVIERIRKSKTAKIVLISVASVAAAVVANKIFGFDCFGIMPDPGDIPPVDG